LATTVYDVLEIELRDGSTVTLKPLPIKQLRKFMDIINASEESGNDNPDAAMDVFVQAALVCMASTDRPDLADRDKFEDLVETPTMMKILDVVGGLKLSDPNLLGAALVGTN